MLVALLGLSGCGSDPAPYLSEVHVTWAARLYDGGVTDLNQFMPESTGLTNEVLVDLGHEVCDGLTVSQLQTQRSGQLGPEGARIIVDAARRHLC